MLVISKKLKVDEYIQELLDALLKNSASIGTVSHEEISNILDLAERELSDGETQAVLGVFEKRCITVVGDNYDAVDAQ